MESLNKALAQFHAMGVSVTKNARGQVTQSAGYSYADLPHVIETIRPLLTQCGLIVTQRTAVNGEDVILITQLIHVETGESIQSDLPIYMDEKPQAFGSRLTYYRRYAYLTILGIAPEDDDGATAQTGYAPSHANHSQPARHTNGHNRPPQQSREPGDDHCPDCGEEMRPSRNGGLYCHSCWKAKSGR